MLDALLLVTCFLLFGWLVKELIEAYIEHRKEKREKAERKLANGKQTDSNST